MAEFRKNIYKTTNQPTKINHSLPGSADQSYKSAPNAELPYKDPTGGGDEINFQPFDPTKVGGMVVSFYMF